MNKLPILIGLGAVVLMGSSSTKKKSTQNNVKIDPLVAEKSIKIDPLLSKAVCKSTEYLNKEGICQMFWNDQTPAKVKEQLEIELKGYDLKDWDSLCAQKELKDGVGLDLNSNHVKILSKVIIKLWPEIKITQLPPTNKSPLYIIVLWQKATAVYYDMVCGIADLPPIT
jgi:hypothetical protein